MGFLKNIFLLGMYVVIFQSFAWGNDGLYQTSAEEQQSVSCQLDSNGAGAGSIVFIFNSPSQELGFIRYNGLFAAANGKYKAITREVVITKLQGSKDWGYTFEGFDETIGDGAIRGTFKSPDDFEVNGYFSKEYSEVECIYYRLTPFKSSWAKEIVKDNPKFLFN